MDWKNGKRLPPRDGYGQGLLELCAQREDIVVLDADVAASTRTNWVRDQQPEHFYNLGISEQDLVGTAAGLALGGMTPYVSTYGVFLSGRFFSCRAPARFPLLRPNHPRSVVLDLFPAGLARRVSSFRLLALLRSSLPAHALRRSRHHHALFLGKPVLQIVPHAKPPSFSRAYRAQSNPAFSSRTTGPVSCPHTGHRVSPSFARQLGHRAASASSSSSSSCTAHQR